MKLGRKIAWIFACLWLVCMTQTINAAVQDPQQIKEHYSQVLTRPEYQYKPELDYMAQVSNWLISLLASLNESMGEMRYAPQLAGLSYIVMWAILIMTAAALTYWMIKWLQQYKAPELDLRPRPEGKRFFGAPESYEPRIRQAIEVKDWSGALRFSWLKFLSQLERHEFVTADRTRTNWEYLAQLRAQVGIPAQAGELTRELVNEYDLHIYGQLPLLETEWKHWDEVMQRVHHLLKLNRPTSGRRFQTS